MSTSQVKVYWGSGSPFAWKVLLALEEKKIPYDGTLLTFSKSENKTPEYLALNPRGKVPVLQYEGDTLYESSAILMYLENKFPQNPLLPASNYARILTRTAEISYVKEIDVSSPEKTKEVIQPILEEYDKWERYISEGPFLFGAQPTLADVSFFPHLALLVRFGFDLQKRFPKLNAFYENMISRESVKKTWPPHWKETPRKTLLTSFS